MSRLTRLPVSIATTALKVPVTLARFGLSRLRGGEDEGPGRPDAASPPPPAAPARKPGAPRRKPAARKAPAAGGSRAKRATATSVPQPEAPAAPAPAGDAAGGTGRSASEALGDGDHVDRDAVEVMSLGPSADPGPEIDMDPAVKALGTAGKRKPSKP